MKIAVVSTFSPFVMGGAEYVINDLIKELSKRKGIEVFHFTIPFPDNFNEQMVQFSTAVRSFNFDDYDVLIAFKYPAYCIPHRNKVVWLFHQFRQVYELWGIEFGFKDTPENKALKGFVMKSDEVGLRGAKQILSLSYEVARRLKNYNSIDSKILYAPLADESSYGFSSIGDFIIYPSRISKIKRQHLAVEAMKHVKSNIKLLIIGKSEDMNYQNQIESFIKNNNLKSKVQLLGSISQEEKFELFSKCLGVTFIPYREDYGLVTLEAGFAHKPIITTSDSGGIMEFITHGKNGIVTEPNAKSLAEAFDQLYTNKEQSREFGEAAYEHIKSLQINWNNVIDRILE